MPPWAATSAETIASPRPVPPAVRARDEPGRGETGPAVVGLGDLRAGDVHLAGDARRHRPEQLVEQLDPQAGDRAADGAARRVRPDGVVRDVAGIDEVGVATFARNAHPATGSNEGPGAINVPVQVGGVVVHPGDVLRGDASGVVVVSREHLDMVITLTRTVQERETAWRQAVADGVSMAAATGVDALIDERRSAAATQLP